MPAKSSVEVPDKDVPLRDDIRLLGRILGDTVREQEGEATFEIVERIRQTSIRFHRDDEEAARHDLEAAGQRLTLQPGKLDSFVIGAAIGQCRMRSRPQVSQRGRSSR